MWRNHAVNYIRKGPRDGRKVLLVHGFGASAYHWRHNILVLAEGGYSVYAIDLLGFGRSDKPLTQYGPALWTEQLVAFIEQVVQAPAAIVGNSIGGYSALRAAALRPDLVTALALINGAGPFSDDDQDARLQKQLASGGEQTLLALGQMAATSASLPEEARSTIERGLVSAAFFLLRTPARVREILGALYPASASNIDDELISSILLPAYHPNALDVYCRIMSRSPRRRLGDDDFVDALSGRLEQPLLLLWGDRDPWVQPAVADRLERAYGGRLCERVRLTAGHCPMDEVPAQVNQALSRWLASLPVAAEPSA